MPWNQAILQKHWSGPLEPFWILAWFHIVWLRYENMLMSMNSFHNIQTPFHFHPNWFLTSSWQSVIGDRYLELCPNRHVTAKMFLHLINVLSVGLHDRREGHKVCPDSEFHTREEKKLDPYFGNLWTKLAMSGEGLLIRDNDRCRPIWFLRSLCIAARDSGSVTMTRWTGVPVEWSRMEATRRWK